MEENIRRKILVFWTTYGGLFLRAIGIIAAFLFFLRIMNNFYAESLENQKNISNMEQISEEETQEDKAFITEFLNACNEHNIDKAYSMLSDKCKQEKYQNVDIFKTTYINSIFTYKKEFTLEKENEQYKVSIKEGILQSGKIENRESIISYYKIEETVLGKKLYIER